VFFAAFSVRQHFYAGRMPTRRPNTLKRRILFIHAGLLALRAILWAPKTLNAEALFTISALSKQRNGVVRPPIP
jgi:hypothetical protein